MSHGAVEQVTGQLGHHGEPVLSPPLLPPPSGGELSGVPDGRGGVLPTIKRPLPGSGFSPVTEESRMLGYPTSPSNNAPPPLVPQRPSQLNSLSRQSSSSNTAFFFGNPSTRPMRQVGWHFHVLCVCVCRRP